MKITVPFSLNYSIRSNYAAAVALACIGLSAWAVPCAVAETPYIDGDSGFAVTLPSSTRTAEASLRVASDAQSLSGGGNDRYALTLTGTQCDVQTTGGQRVTLSASTASHAGSGRASGFNCGSVEILNFSLAGAKHDANGSLTFTDYGLWQLDDAADGVAMLVPDCTTRANGTVMTGGSGAAKAVYANASFSGGDSISLSLADGFSGSTGGTTGMVGMVVVDTAQPSVIPTNETDLYGGSWLDGNRVLSPAANPTSSGGSGNSAAVGMLTLIPGQLSAEGAISMARINENPGTAVVSVGNLRVGSANPVQPGASQGDFAYMRTTARVGEERSYLVASSPTSGSSRFNGTMPAIAEVPEPSTYLGGLLLLAVAGWSQRRALSRWWGAWRPEPS